PTGWKGHEFPHLDALPCFVNGAPVVHAYTSLDELVGLVEGRGIEVLFCIGRKPVVERLRERVPPPRLFVAQLQTAWDSLVLHVGVHNLHTFDAIYGFSPHWVAWWASYQVLH